MMRALALPWRSLDITAAADAAWRWWLAELRGMLPPRFLALAGVRRSRITVAITQDAVTVARANRGTESEVLRVAAAEIGRTVAAASLKSSVGERDIVVLRLPPSEALSKPIELPLGAERKLRNILRFELDRQSPLAPERVYFDHQVLRRDKAQKKLAVELRILKRDVVDHALGLCRSLGLEPVLLELGGDARAFDLPAILGGAPRSSASGRRRRLSAALAVLCCMLAASLAYVEWTRERQVASAVAERLARAKAAAQETEQLRKQADALGVQTELLAREKAKPLAAQVVNEITRLLPDGTWLFELEMHGAGIRIRGYSPAASQLIAVFDASPLFTHTRFEAPVTQGPGNGLERFDLSFDLRGEKP